MESHIRKHANEMPDDETADVGTTTSNSDDALLKTEDRSPVKESSVEIEITNSTTSNTPNGNSRSITVYSNTEPASVYTISEVPENLSPINSTMMNAVPVPAHSTRGVSSSKMTSDHLDDNEYASLHIRYEQTGLDYRYNPTTNISPDLLTAVSIATSASSPEAEHISKNHNLPQLDSFIKPEQSAQTISKEFAAIMEHQDAILDTSFIYEPLAIMRQQGYFTPAPKVDEFRLVFLMNVFFMIFFSIIIMFVHRSSIDSANDIVKRVEAALAGTEPLLTPPRSTPESPDRTSSPDSECNVVMADRDIMSLPLRKRKLYLRDNHEPDNEDDVTPSTMMRMSSVIQFAKAS